MNAGARAELTFSMPGGGGPYDSPGGGYAPRGYGEPPGGAPPGPPPMGPRTDALAIVSLVCGILGLLGAGANLGSGILGTCCILCTLGSTVVGVIVLIPALAGVVCGILSARRIDAAPHELGGRSLAVAGVVVSGVAVLLALATIVLPWFGLGCLAIAGNANGAAGGYPPPAP